MKLVLFYVVLAIGFGEIALICLKKCYRDHRALELLRQILGLSRKNDPRRYYDLSVEIVKIKLLPVKIGCLPSEVKWRMLPFCIVVGLLLAGILLWGAIVIKLSPSCPASLAMITSWAVYRLAMAGSDHIASRKNSVANEIRVEKFADDRVLVSRACLAISLIIGLIVYCVFS
jgi:hypothetical protein